MSQSVCRPRRGMRWLGSRGLLLVAAASLLIQTSGADEPTDQPPSTENTLPSLDEVLLFRPTKYPAGEWEPKNLTYEDVWFTSQDGVKLHGWYCPHEKPQAIVLYLHGTGGNLSDRRFLLKHLNTLQRLSVFIVDYRGYGRSEGLPTVEGVIQDAVAARLELSRLAKVKPSQIVLMGRSLGGAIAVQLAAAEAPRGLIVESSFSSLKEVAKFHFPQMAAVVPEDKLDSATTIKRYRGPFLQSHGERDTLIPLESGLALFKAANKPKRLIRIPGADHNDPQSRAYYRALGRFLRTLPPD